MTTPRDICNAALFDSGIIGTGQTATADMIDRAFKRLNWMLTQWQRKRWLVFVLEDLSIVSTAAVSYTVGPGGNINTTVRPNQLEAAYFRQTVQSQPNQIDYTLTVLPSREDYSRIAIKQLQSFPSYIWYESSYPLGRIYPWPVPQANIYEIHILVKAILSQFTSLSQTISLPGEYEPALQQNLAVRMRQAYQLPPDPQLNALAKDSLNVLRTGNAQIAKLYMPAELIRPGIYNPYSDQMR